MRTLFFLSLILCSSVASAQIVVQIPAPTIVFPAPPPVVVVQPGVEVVEDNDDEIFVVNHVYWVRRRDHWFYTRDHRGGWVRGEPPGSIVRLPPGQYKHWKHGGGPPGQQKHKDKR